MTTIVFSRMINRAAESVRFQLGVRLAINAVCGVAAVVCVLASPAIVRSQEAQWTFRIAGGFVRGHDERSEVDETTEARVDPWSRVVSFEAARRLDCCLDVFAALLVNDLDVSLGAGVQTTAEQRMTIPGFEFGLTYRAFPRPNIEAPSRWWFHVSPFVRVQLEGHSPIVEIGSNTGLSREANYRTRTSVGLGLGLGGRYHLNDQFAVDARIKYEHLSLHTRQYVRLVNEAGATVEDVLNDGKLNWNPLTLNLGVSVRLF